MLLGLLFVLDSCEEFKRLLEITLTVARFQDNSHNSAQEDLNLAQKMVYAWHFFLFSIFS